MAELRRWVTDQLYDIIGFAEQSVVEFIIAYATKTPKVANILGTLHSYDVPLNSKTEAFARELVKRVPRKRVEANRARAAEKKKAAIDLNRRNDQFELLDDSEGNEELNVKVQKKKKKKKKRRRSVTPERSEGSQKAAKHQDNEDVKETEEERKIREREEDIKARDEFAERRLKAEEDKTRRLVGGGSSGNPNAKVTDEDFEALLPHLRESSRQEYLKKREGLKLEELRRIVADEEFL